MKKRLYIQPIIETVVIGANSAVLTVSPGTGNIDNNGGGGNSIDPD